MLGALAGLGFLPGFAWGQASASFPSRPVTLVVPFPPGGVNDVIARELGQRLGQRWGVSVAIANRPGAGTIIGTDEVARATPDGYTLLVTSMAHATAHSFFPKLPYDPVRSFEPIGLIAASPFVLVVRDGLPVQTVTEFLTYSRSHPGLSYGSTGMGGSSHLITELLRSRVGCQWSHVPYKGASPAVADVAGSQLDFTLSAYGTVSAFLQARRIRALAVTSRQRLPALPQVPSLAESGIAGFEAGPWWGLAAPVRTPANVLGRLRQDLADTLRDSSLVAALETKGLRVIGGDAATYSEHMTHESTLWARLIREARIQSE